MDLKRRDLNCDFSRKPGREADSVDRRQEELGIHILENIRNELYYYFPYLDGAFACISGKGSEQTRTIGTDGAFFLFSPEYLLELYVKKPEAVRRGWFPALIVTSRL